MFDREIPEPTEEEVRPCRCGLDGNMYNMGQFHLRAGSVVGWCHEYRDLAGALVKARAALKHADRFGKESQQVSEHMLLIHNRLEELKRGGTNR